MKIRWTMLCLLAGTQANLWSGGFAQDGHSAHNHQEAVTKPRIYLDKSPRIVAYQLNRLSNAQLLLVDRSTDDAKYAPVYRAIMLRPGMSLEHREQALMSLTTIQKTTTVDELLGALDGLRLEDRNQESVFRQLTRLMLQQSKTLLQEELPKLRAALDAETEGVRIASHAALVSLGLEEEAWSRANRSDGGRVDFLRAVEYLPLPEMRAGLRHHAVACLDERHSATVRRTAIRTLANIATQPARSFLAIAPLVREPQYRIAGIRALLKIPKIDWPANEVEQLLQTLVAHVESIPPEERTSNAELEGLQLADDLLALVPAGRARPFRDRLRAVAVRVVQIDTVHEEMRYDKAYFAVEAGRPVQVVLRNHDAMPHNLVITAPGALRDVAEQASRMGSGPGTDGKQYVPDSPQVLYATPMVQPDQQARLVFDAPEEPGEYPYVCTFPRHWMRMYGVMVVVPDLDAWLADPQEPDDPLGNTREFVKQWSLDDFADLDQALRGRNPQIGERLFQEATCAQCHKVQGQGGMVGPELSDVFPRWKGDRRAVLREVLEPSYKIEPKYAMHTVLTDGGQVLSGVITSQDANAVTIVTNPEAPQPQVVRRSDIEEMIKSTISMMPKGLLDRFTRDEIYELLAYLESSAEDDAEQNGHDDTQLQPSAQYPSYWQFRGRPVLLAGGSDDDNLFQWPASSLRRQLDKLQQAGGNYIRNTMSDRHDNGFELYPYRQLPDGKYDLEQWNGEYWNRFETMLRMTAARGIVVQIEVWDRFDYSRDSWRPHPYNPRNNVNYSHQQSGLEAEYPAHPGRNRQPFFFTTPLQHDNQVLLRYQHRFVDELLSRSLQHGHVLYCIDNETSGEAAWAIYWTDYIRGRAKRAGKTVYVTQMWDDWDLRGAQHRHTLDRPELYDFVDASQNNHNHGQRHWDNFAWIREYISQRPRPINTVKTYGADGNKFGHTNQDGVERFWRHLIAGAAAVRFHRPDSGLGLSKTAIASLHALRKLESLVELWEVVPANDLLDDRRPNEAYLAARPGEAYVLYFPHGGSVRLQLGAANGPFTLKWVNVDTGDWGGQSQVAGGHLLTLSAPTRGNWIAALTR